MSRILVQLSRNCTCGTPTNLINSKFYSVLRPATNGTILSINQNKTTDHVRFVGSETTKTTAVDAQQPKTSAVKDDHEDSVIETVERYNTSLKKVMTPFKKFVMVSSKYYNSMSEVPDIVPESSFANAMDRFRVKVAMGLCFLTVAGGLVTIKVGQRRRNAYLLKLQEEQDAEDN